MIRPRDFAYLQELVLRHSGIVLGDGKEYLAESRLSGIVHGLGLKSLDELFARLRPGSFGELDRRIVEAMTTTETQFFRDASAFALLRKQILPELLAAREDRRVLRICSAACATGQEPYSLAMLLREDFAAQLRGWQVEILALDLGRATIERARAGRYSLLEINRGLPARLLVRFFDQDGDDWVVQPALRQMVEFRQFNLCQELLPGRFDLVLMRNVLMYFDASTREMVLRSAARCLNDDAALLLGATESVLGGCGLRRELHEGSICYRPAPEQAPGTPRPSEVPPGAAIHTPRQP